MSIDSIVGQIERLTLAVPEVRVREKTIPDMFLVAKVSVIKKLLDENQSVALTVDLSRKILSLIGSISQPNFPKKLEGFKNQVTEVCKGQKENSPSVCDYVSSYVYSFCENIFGQSTVTRFSEKWLHKANKTQFWDHIEKRKFNTLVIDRKDRPSLVYSGQVLKRLIARQVELPTLAEDYTIRLDTGETIGVVGKEVFSFCDKSHPSITRKERQVVHKEKAHYYPDFPDARPCIEEIKITQEIEVKEISFNALCDLISEVALDKVAQIKDESVSITLLPANLLGLIFSQVPNRTFLNCRLVCKAWNQALNNQAAWGKRYFPLNIANSNPPAHAIFFSPVGYQPEDKRWRNMRHRIKDIVCLANGGHVGAQVELAQRVLSNEGNYDIAGEVALEWLKNEKSPRISYIKGLNWERLDLFSIAKSDLLESAKQGWAPAQNRMGVLYHEGEKLPKDPRKAKKWFVRAAAQANVDAQNNLGILHLHSDKDVALQWSLLAAKQGHAGAQCRVGVLLYESANSIDDVKNALMWMERAADQNHVLALNRLGSIYKNNSLVKDGKESFKFYRLGALTGDAEAQYNLGLLYEKGIGVPKNLEEAANWYLQAAEQGYVDAQYALGILHYGQSGMPEDLPEAFKWLLAAAEQGNVDAQYLVATMYKEGKGVAADDAKACEWLKPAADSGHVEANYRLGWSYWAGVGVPKNVKEAHRLLSFAAEKGHKHAQYAVGRMFAEGVGVEKSPETAFAWFLLSAKQGYKLAQQSVGYAYQHGEGVVRNVKEAIKWYEFVALGHLVPSQVPDYAKAKKEQMELEALIERLRLE